MRSDLKKSTNNLLCIPGCISGMNSVTYEDTATHHDERLFRHITGRNRAYKVVIRLSYLRKIEHSADVSFVFF